MSGTTDPTLREPDTKHTKPYSSPRWSMLAASHDPDRRVSTGACSRPPGGIQTRTGRCTLPRHDDTPRRARRSRVALGGIATLAALTLSGCRLEAGFGAGVDDYVVKPFSPRELLSRVQAVLARTST